MSIPISISTVVMVSELHLYSIVVVTTVFVS